MSSPIADRLAEDVIHHRPGAIAALIGHAKALESASNAEIAGSEPLTVTYRLAGLLRDARQDPQPATDTHTDQPTVDELQAALNVQFDAPVPVPTHWQPIQQAAYRDGWLDAMQRVKDSTDTACAARLLGGGE